MKDIAKLNLAVKRIKIEKFAGDVIEGAVPIETIIIEGDQIVRMLNEPKENTDGAN